MSKRRFGIAISADIAKELDVISGECNTDRSRIVEYAVKNFLREYKHHSKCHRCTGVLVITRNSIELGEGSMTYREFKHIIVSYSHHHVDDKCIEILLLSGNSEVIAEFHRRLLRDGCDCRYIPLHSD